MRDWQHDLELVQRRRWVTLVVLCVSLLVIVLDNSILNVALPTLAKPVAQGGIGATESNLQWIVDAYTIVFAGLLLTAGSLGDRFGRYGALAIGLSVFGLGSGMAAFASDPAWLIGWRSFMGIGGALIMPATLSIITNVFTDPRERGRAIGVWAGVSAIGIGVGPVTGGFLLQHFWWGSVLLVNVPIVIVGLVLGWRYIPNSRDPEAPRLDPLGALLSIVGLTTVLWAVIEGPTRGWGSTPIVAGFVIGAVVLAAFMAWELTYSNPMLDLHFFENPRFSAASGSITLTFMALFGVIFLLTQYLQSVLGFSPLKAGAVLLPMSATMMVFAPTSARVVERVGTKLVVGTGLLLAATSLLLQTQLQTTTGVGLIILVTMILGMGMANVMAPATESIMGSLPRAKAGVGSAVNDTTRQVGGAVGVALLGSLLSSRYLTQMDQGLSGVALSPGPARQGDRQRRSGGRDRQADRWSARRAAPAGRQRGVRLRHAPRRGRRRADHLGGGRRGVPVAPVPCPGRRGRRPGRRARRRRRRAGTGRAGARARTDLRVLERPRRATTGRFRSGRVVDVDVDRRGVASRRRDVAGDELERRGEACRVVGHGHRDPPHERTRVRVDVAAELPALVAVVPANLHGAAGVGERRTPVAHDVDVAGDPLAGVGAPGPAVEGDDDRREGVAERGESRLVYAGCGRRATVRWSVAGRAGGRRPLRRSGGT